MMYSVHRNKISANSSIYRCLETTNLSNDMKNCNLHDLHWIRLFESVYGFITFYAKVPNLPTPNIHRNAHQSGMMRCMFRWKKNIFHKIKKRNGQIQNMCPYGGATWLSGSQTYVSHFILCKKCKFYQSWIQNTLISNRNHTETKQKPNLKIKPSNNQPKINSKIL